MSPLPPSPRSGPATHPAARYLLEQVQRWFGEHGLVYQPDLGEYETALQLLRERGWEETVWRVLGFVVRHCEGLGRASIRRAPTAPFLLEHPWPAQPEPLDEDALADVTIGDALLDEDCNVERGRMFLAERRIRFVRPEPEPNPRQLPSTVPLAGLDSISLLRRYPLRIDQDRLPRPAARYAGEPTTAASASPRAGSAPAVHDAPTVVAQAEVVGWKAVSVEIERMTGMRFGEKTLRDAADAHEIRFTTKGRQVVFARSRIEALAALMRDKRPRPRRLSDG